MLCWCLVTFDPVLVSQRMMFAQKQLHTVWTRTMLTSPSHGLAAARTQRLARSSQRQVSCAQLVPRAAARPVCLQPQQQVALTCFRQRCQTTRRRGISVCAGERRGRTHLQRPEMQHAPLSHYRTLCPLRGGSWHVGNLLPTSSTHA